MKLLTIICLFAVSLAGCESSPKVPGEGQTKKNYPAVVKDSADRRSKAEREWRRMLDSYGVPQTPPDLYPVTDTPRSLLGVSGGIKLLTYKPDRGDEAIAIREAMKVFIDRWRELLGVDPAAVSLVGATEADTLRLTYRQANYAYPVAGTFGEMVAVISKDGRLMQLDDRFLPAAVDLPLKPTVERDIVAKKVIGKTFTYTDIAGREQRTQIGAPNEVSVKRLVVLPIEKSDSIDVHLAWEVVAGKSISWTVYMDAVTGEELRVVQNFQT